MRSLTAIIVSLWLTLLCPSVLRCADQDIGSLKNKQEDFALARTTLGKAAEVALRVKGPIHRVHLLEWIAVSQAKVEDVSGALKTAAKIGDSKRTVLAMADIASLQAKQGQKQASAKTFQEAHKLAASLEKKWDQGYAFGKIAEQEAKSQHADAEKTFVQAIEIARALPLDHEKASLLFYIGASQCDAGLVPAAGATFKESSRFLSTVEDDFRKWMTASQLAPFQVRAGDDEGALATANHLVDQKEFPFKSQGLSSVATAQAEHGNVETALRTSSAIEDERAKEGAWRWIVEAHLQAGYLQEAVHLTEMIQNDLSAKMLALVSVAKAQGKAGDTAGAEQTVDQVVHLFEKGVSSANPPWSAFVVGHLAEMGQRKKAVGAAAIIKSKPDRALALSVVAEAYGKAGDRKTAEQLLAQALGPDIDGYALRGISVAYAQIGNVPAALKTARNIPEESVRSSALQRIANVQTQQGHAREALKWASSLKSPYLKSSALLGVGLGIIQKYGI